MMDQTAMPPVDDLWDYQEPANAEARFRALLPAAQAAGDLQYLVELLTQIARSEGLQRRFEDAHRTLDAAEARIDGLTRARVRYLLERGRVFNSSGDRERARPLFQEAWELGQTLEEHYHAVDAAHMLAIVAESDEQLAWNERALQYAEASGDAHAARWVGSLQNNLGWTYHDLGRYDDALAAFSEALVWHEEQGTVRDLRIAHWAVARVLRSLGRYQDALAIQRDNLVRAAQSQDDDGYIDEEIGECLLALGKVDDSRQHFARAWQLLSQDGWLNAHEPERLARLKILGP